MKVYTGIGSRKAPLHKQREARYLAYLLNTIIGLKLRSGRAEGMDYAFQQGASTGGRVPHSALPYRECAEIFIPKLSFGKEFGDQGLCKLVPKYGLLREKLEALVYVHHKYGDTLKGFALEAHCRNMQQVLGYELDDPTDFVVYWAPEDKFGMAKGGTATAVSVAISYGIPVFNMLHDDWADNLFDTLIHHRVPEAETAYQMFKAGKGVEY
ncbi:DprA-like DNA recombination-mediator protein [Proteus phage vB_PMC-PL1]